MDFLTSPTLSASIQHTTRPSSKCANVLEIISCFFKCPSVVYFHRWLIRLSWLTVAWMGIINFDQLVIGVSCNIFLDYRTKGSGSMRLLYLPVYIDIISTSWRIAVHAALSGLTEIRPIIIRPQYTVISVEIQYNCGIRLNYSVYGAMRREASSCIAVSRQVIYDDDVILWCQSASAFTVHVTTVLTELVPVTVIPASAAKLATTVSTGCCYEHVATIYFMRDMKFSSQATALAYF